MVKQRKKRVNRFTILLIALIVFMCAVIAAVAAILPALQRQRANDFRPAKPEIGIIENDSEPEKTSENELVFSRNESGRYELEKKVQITSTKNSEYIKVMLLPQWYDSDGILCGGLGDISDFGKAAGPDAETQTQTYFSSSNPSFDILTLHLPDDWDKYWQYDNSTGFYHYKKPLSKGEVTQPLILSVSVSKEVYEQTADYELHLDVITESIQTNADAGTIRDFGRPQA